MLRRNMTSAECQISDPKGRYLVFTLLFFQMPLMKTQDLNTKIITKKPGSARNCESWGSLYVASTIVGIHLQLATERDLRFRDFVHAEVPGWQKARDRSRGLRARLKARSRVWRPAEPRESRPGQCRTYPRTFPSWRSS